MHTVLQIVTTVPSLLVSHLATAVSWTWDHPWVLSLAGAVMCTTGAIALHVRDNLRRRAQRVG